MAQTEYQRQWYQKNRKRLLEYQAQYRKNNPEKIKARDKRYHKANRKRIQEYQKQYRKDNHDKLLARGRRYRKDNLEKIRASSERYCKRNRKKARERAREWRMKNHDRYLQSLRNWRKQNTNYQKKYAKQYFKENSNKWRQYDHKRRAILKDAGTYTSEEWDSLCEFFGNKCLACGKKEVTIDHIIPLHLGGTNTIDNLQPLCKSCNSSKRTKIIDYRKEFLDEYFQRTNSGTVQRLPEDTRQLLFCLSLSRLKMAPGQT